jgi:hypothetical protein
MSWTLRPPWLRGVPGLLGWRAFLAGLPGRAPVDDTQQLPCM